jgi:type II secretory pathway component PulJ
MRSDRGAVLLEALVAMVLVSLSAALSLHVLRAALADLRSVAEREDQIRAASRTLAGYALLTASELDQRIGTQRRGGFIVRVQRPERGAYRIAVADTLVPGHELLVTVAARRPAP